MICSVCRKKSPSCLCCPLCNYVYCKKCINKPLDQCRVDKFECLKKIAELRTEISRLSQIIRDKNRRNKERDSALEKFGDLNEKYRKQISDNIKISDKSLCVLY